MQVKKSLSVWASLNLFGQPFAAFDSKLVSQNSKNGVLLFGRGHFAFACEDSLFLRRFSSVTNFAFDYDSEQLTIQGGLLEKSFEFTLAPYPHWDQEMRTRVDAEILTLIEVSKRAEAALTRPLDQSDTLVFTTPADYFKVFADLCSQSQGDYPESVAKSITPTAAACWPNSLQLFLLLFDGDEQKWNEVLAIVFNGNLYLFQNIGAAYPLCKTPLRKLNVSNIFLNEDLEFVPVQPIIKTLVKHQVRLTGSQRLTRQCERCKDIDDFLKVCEVTESSTFMNVIEFQNIRQVVRILVEEADSLTEAFASKQYHSGHPAVSHLSTREESSCGVSYCDDQNLELSILKPPTQFFFSAETIEMLNNFGDMLKYAQERGNKEIYSNIQRKSFQQKIFGAVRFLCSNDVRLAESGDLSIKKVTDGSGKSFGFVLSLPLKTGGKVDLHNENIESMGFNGNELVIQFSEHKLELILELEDASKFNEILSGLK